MGKKEREYTVCRGDELLCREFDLGTAIARAYEASEIRPDEPVEVKRRGAANPVFWRVVHR
jgi:hypothetical protein